MNLTISVCDSHYIIIGGGQINDAIEKRDTQTR